MKKILGILAGLAVAGVLFWSWAGNEEEDESTPPRPENGSNGSDGTAPGLKASEDGEERVRVIERNPFLFEYGQEGGSAKRDLEILRDVVRDCQLVFRDFDRFHLPGNAGLTAFLQGENPDALAWIPPGHAAVGPQGRLRDRFGTPVFFHRLSGTRFEYRSAGPDRKLWSDDDIVVK